MRSFSASFFPRVHLQLGQDQLRVEALQRRHIRYTLDWGVWALPGRLLCAVVVCDRQEPDKLPSLPSSFCEGNKENRTQWKEVLTSSSAIRDAVPGSIAPYVRNTACRQMHNDHLVCASTRQDTGGMVQASHDHPASFIRMCIWHSRKPDWSFQTRQKCTPAARTASSEPRCCWQ